MLLRQCSDADYAACSFPGTTKTEHDIPAFNLGKSLQRNEDGNESLAFL